jgi:hypothetical protein
MWINTKTTFVLLVFSQSHYRFLQEYMDDIAELCNQRYSSLAAEESGSKLLSFHVPPSNSPRVLAIRRQDHPEVKFGIPSNYSCYFT